MIRQSFSCAILALLACGCRREAEIETYRVPKETSSSPVPMATADPHAGMTMPGGSGADPHAAMPQGGTAMAPLVVGEVPDTWEPGPGSSMRLASYRVAGEGDAMADISLSSLSGAAGGVLDNVNRWRGQVGLPPVDEAGLQASATELRTPVGDAVVFDLDGGSAGGGRILAAILPRGGETWFYKMYGTAAGLVGREKAGFLHWVETAEPRVSIPETPAPRPIPSGPPTGVTWQVPEDWAELPGDALRLAAFSTTGGGEVTVIKLGGEGGGELANVNRWRGQIGLEPLDTLTGAVDSLRAGDVELSLVDLAGTTDRTIAAWTRHQGATWFFKLTGPAEAVARGRERFVGFVESVAFSGS